MNTTNSQSLFAKAKELIPGGVNSPVRAFRAVGGNPIFIKSAKGAYLTDEDNNTYIDMINSWGPMILGHAFEDIEKAVVEAAKSSMSFGAPTRKEVEIAELIISMVPGLEKVRMVNSGTEATMSAIRLARGYTGNDKIIKFEGCYHGHGDSFLIAAGSGAMTLGTPDSPGVTSGTAKDTLIATYNDIENVKLLTEANKGEIAAIILEPVVGNMGCVLPKDGFLQDLRVLCDKEGILLIFDEVMTGFRLAAGGAQELFGVEADLVTFGKIIGGGMPVGAYGGKKEVMDHIAPAGPIYQAGTLSGNPIAMSAGYVMLSYLNDHPEIYKNLENTTSKITNGLKQLLDRFALPYTINQVGSMYSLFFTDKKVVDWATAKSCNTEVFGQYFRKMLEQGVYLAPSQFESLFISNAISDTEINKILESSENALREIHS